MVLGLRAVAAKVTVIKAFEEVENGSWHSFK